MQPAWGIAADETGQQVTICQCPASPTEEWRLRQKVVADCKALPLSLQPSNLLNCSPLLQLFGVVLELCQSVGSLALDSAYLAERAP